MTVYYQFNILPKKSTVHHEMAWFTNYQNNARMTSARKQTLFRSHCSAWSGNVQSCVRYVCSIQMCVVCSLIQVTHSRGQDLNEKFYWKLLLWLTCQRETASQGTHTASVVAHDGLTSKIGFLLAMTVGSCRKEFSFRCKHWKGILWLQGLLFQIGNFFKYNANEQITRSERR